MKPRACELCNQQAFLYCPSDSAFLCCNCDATVHRANFLVARHLRNLLCSKCNRFAGSPISGPTPPPLTPTCRSCSPDHSDSRLSSSSSLTSSACVSSSESCAAAPKKIKVRVDGRRRMRISSSSSVTDDGGGQNCGTPARNVGWCAPEAAAEEVFVDWSRELGVNGNCAASSIAFASRALGFCLENWRALPLRVAAATTFWMGLRFCRDRSVATLENLRRLEAMSGVPAKLILGAEARVLSLRRRPKRHFNLVEGWAESRC